MEADPYIEIFDSSKHSSGADVEEGACPSS